MLSLSVVRCPTRDKQVINSSFALCVSAVEYIQIETSSTAQEGEHAYTSLFTWTIGLFVSFCQGSEPAIAAMGGHFTQTVDREVMTYSATVAEADVPKAMAVLTDAVKVRRVVVVVVVLAAVGLSCCRCRCRCRICACCVFCYRCHE